MGEMKITPEQVAYTLVENRMGHVTLTQVSTGKDVYFQYQSDVEAIKESLKKGEKKDLEGGWTITVKNGEPRTSTFSQYFD